MDTGKYLIWGFFSRLELHTKVFFSLPDLLALTMADSERMT